MSDIALRDLLGVLIKVDRKRRAAQMNRRSMRSGATLWPSLRACKTPRILFVHEGSKRNNLPG
jgi:hypothetical protein